MCVLGWGGGGVGGGGECGCVGGGVGGGGVSLCVCCAFYQCGVVSFGGVPADSNGVKLSHGAEEDLELREAHAALSTDVSER